MAIAGRTSRTKFRNQVLKPLLDAGVIEMTIPGHEEGMGINMWRSWMGRIPVFGAMPKEIVWEILQHMLKTNILSHDQGVLWFGEKGEKIFGFRNFMEICSVFTSPPLYTVKHGRNLIGYVNEITFAGSAETRVILLGEEDGLFPICRNPE